jgi:hypothetical protein
VYGTLSGTKEAIARSTPATIAANPDARSRFEVVNEFSSDRANERRGHGSLRPPREETGSAFDSYLTGEEKLASPRSTSAQAQYT